MCILSASSLCLLSAACLFKKHVLNSLVLFDWLMWQLVQPDIPHQLLPAASEAGSTQRQVVPPSKAEFDSHDPSLGHISVANDSGELGLCMGICWGTKERTTNHQRIVAVLVPVFSFIHEHLLKNKQTGPQQEVGSFIEVGLFFCGQTGQPHSQSAMTGFAGRLH